MTADHITFRECIEAFRPDPRYPERDPSPYPQWGSLLLDFALPGSVGVPGIHIGPSTEIYLGMGHAAFVSPVELAPSDHSNHAVLFTTALAAVMSFATGREISSPRHDHIPCYRPPKAEELTVLAVHHPILTAGPGARRVRPSQARLLRMIVPFNETVLLLQRIPYADYVSAMQAIRLVQLAHLTVREDFGLGYYLMLSAVESVAQRAITVRDVRSKHPMATEWKRMAKADPLVAKLYEAYTQEWGKQQHLAARFTEFIMRFCPPTEWEEMEHPLADLIDAPDSVVYELSRDIASRRFFDIVYPSDLSENDIRAVLAQAYRHRSKFTHEGLSPPHRTPNSYNHYFDVDLVPGKEVGEYTPMLLPTYRLIGFIARRAISRYLRTLDPRPRS